MIFKDIRTEVKEMDDKKGIVTMYVSAFGNEDSDRDIIMRGSYAKTIQEGKQRIKHLKNHKRDVLLGYPIEMQEDNFGLLVTSKMNLDKQIVKDTYSDYKFFAEGGLTLEHSVAIEILKWENEPERRIIKEVRLSEYSTLDFWGANEMTPMVDIKSHNDMAASLAILEDMLKKGNYSDEKFKSIENKIKEIKALVSGEPLDNTQDDKEPLLLNFYKSLNF